MPTNRAPTEDLLVELQNAAYPTPSTRPFSSAPSRTGWQRDIPGAAGVTYVPPEPELAVELMEG
ncbi:MAG: hypothetical protein R3E56_16920 [Burkholderiaceae bacterium]